jgi:hypothetical protein
VGFIALCGSERIHVLVTSENDGADVAKLALTGLAQQPAA